MAFLPRTPLPPQNDPATLMRQSTTARVGNALQGQPGSGTSLLGPPLQQPPGLTGNLTNTGLPPSGQWGGQPTQWGTNAEQYANLMRSAKPGIAHIMQLAQQNQRPTSSTWNNGTDSAQTDPQYSVTSHTDPVLPSSQPPWTPGQEIPQESGLGRFFRQIAPFVGPYGTGFIPGIVHSINQHRMQQGNRDWREAAQNAPINGPHGDPYGLDPGGADYPGGNDTLPQGGEPNPLQSHFRDTVNLRPDDPNYPGYDAGYDPSQDPWADNSDPASQGPYFPPTTSSTENSPTSQSGLNWILGQVPGLNNPASVRALQGGASVQQLLGRNQFDSQAQNSQLMDFVARHDPTNYTGTTTDAGRDIFFGGNSGSMQDGVLTRNANPAARYQESPEQRQAALRFNANLQANLGRNMRAGRFG